MVVCLSRTYQFANARSGKQQQPPLQLKRARENVLRQPTGFKITEAVTQYIDGQPLSVVDNMGLCHPISGMEPRYEIFIHHHIADTVLPKRREFVEKHIYSLVHPQPAA